MKYFQINVLGWINSQFVAAATEEEAIRKCGAKPEEVSFIGEIPREEYEAES